MKHVGTQEIRTSRLLLRRIESNDAEAMFNNWTSDKEVTRFMRWSAHKDIDETREVIARWLDRYKSDSVYHWGICLETGEIIGSLGIFGSDMDRDFRAAMGYSLGRKWWGQGYTSEAARATIDYMFRNTDLERIEAEHSVRNPASGRVLRKAGMKHEGHARHKYRSNDGFEDCDLYGIIRDDWRRSLITANL